MEEEEKKQAGKCNKVGLLVEHVVKHITDLIKKKLLTSTIYIKHTSPSNDEKNEEKPSQIQRSFPLTHDMKFTK